MGQIALMHKNQNNQTFFQPALIALLMLTLANTVSIAQNNESISATIQTGMRAFYAARFDDAITILVPTLQKKEISVDEQYLANLYIAFSLIRKGENDLLVARYLKSAIELHPYQVPDRQRIPPDLIERYEHTRSNILGSLLVYYQPIEAQVILMDPHYGPQANDGFPARFDHLPPGEYEVIVSLSGYKNRLQRVLITAGQQDSLEIELTLTARNWKKWGTWAGGAVLFSAVLISQLLGSEEEPVPAGVLPEPPGHP